jgi:TetR/AcrR family transcriptional regulator
MTLLRQSNEGGAIQATVANGGIVRRGRSSQLTREMILDAGLHEFAQHGYDGATTASIARRVGVTQPLVHYHFGSKEALWRATVSRLFETLVRQIDEGERDVEGMGPAARLVTLTYLFIDFVVQHPELSRLVNNEGIQQTPRLTWLVESYIRPLMARWERYLDEAKSAGIIKQIPNVYMLFSLLGSLQHFFDVAPMVREIFDVEPRAPETAKAYANALMELFLEGASTRGLDEA